MLSKARSKAEAQFAKGRERDNKLKAADKQLIKDREKAQDERLAKVAKLKALRLGDAPADAAAETDEA